MFEQLHPLIPVRQIIFTAQNDQKNNVLNTAELGEIPPYRLSYKAAKTTHKVLVDVKVL
jgi:hypothetical protein